MALSISAVLSSSARLGRWLRRVGLCAVPEEIDPTIEIAAATGPGAVPVLGPAAALAPTLSSGHAVPLRPDN